MNTRLFQYVKRSLLLLLLIVAASAGRADDEETTRADSMLWRLYQNTIGHADGDRCPSSPSCSAYCEQAIRKHGWLVGWVMTFDRFIHEGTEVRDAEHGIRYRSGRLRAVNEVEHNDFWWFESDDVSREELISSGQQNIKEYARPYGAGNMLTDDELRSAGMRLLALDAPEEALVLFLTLWDRSRQPEDAIIAAFCLLQAQNYAGVVGLMDALLHDEESGEEVLEARHRVVALLAQGLAYRQRGLYEAAADVFSQAGHDTEHTEIGDLLAAYAVESLLKADLWSEAAEAVGVSSLEEALAVRSAMDETLPWRSPWLAGSLSAVLPGSGQLYAGRYQEGFWAFLVCGAFGWAGYEAFDRDLNGVGVAVALTGLSWYSGNIYGAVSAAHKYNERAKRHRIENWAERLGVVQDGGNLILTLMFNY